MGDNGHLEVKTRLQLPYFCSNKLILAVSQDTKLKRYKVGLELFRLLDMRQARMS